MIMSDFFFLNMDVVATFLPTFGVT